MVTKKIRYSSDLDTITADIFKKRTYTYQTRIYNKDKISVEKFRGNILELLLKEYTLHYY